MASQRAIGILMFFICFANGLPDTKDYEHSLDTLQLLHIVFRHGDRTPTGSYPNDPYADETYYPVGLGQLTNAGKNREYNIGSYLRETYGNFLGDVYFPGVLQANSSDMPRCKVSTQLVLASLYPPSAMQRWSDKLDWQPIPYDYVSSSNNLLFFSTSVCSAYNKYIKEYRNSTTYEEVYEPYIELIDYLKEQSGQSSGSGIGSALYSTLLGQEGWGLELPDWTESIWPQPLRDLASLDWQQMFATEETRAIGAGFLLSKIVNDSQLTINGDSSVEDVKIYLYGGHDTNIAAVLAWLGLSHLHVPQYGSFIIFEIHNILGTPSIRVVHQNYENGSPKLVEIPNCGYTCPFTTFVDLYSNYLNPYELCN